jgi:hypothetical protein
MQCLQAATAGKQRGHQADLLVQRAQELGNRLITQGLLGVTGAEPAQAVTERDVDVQGQWLRPADIGDPVPDLPRADAGMEMRRRRIAGVTRDGFAQPVTSCRSLVRHGAPVAAIGSSVP